VRHAGAISGNGQQGPFRFSRDILRSQRGQSRSLQGPTALKTASARLPGRRAREEPIDVKNRAS
jgi:hypothetical protein